MTRGSGSFGRRRIYDNRKSRGRPLIAAALAVNLLFGMLLLASVSILPEYALGAVPRYWFLEPVPPSPAGETVFFSVSMVGGGGGVFTVAPEGWAVGTHAATYHYLGGAWSAGATWFGTDILHSVYMVSAGDVWAVGAAGAMLHYDGTGWGSLSPTAPTAELFSIYMVSANEGWAVGAPETTSSLATILHYDGHLWSLWANPATASLSSVFMVSASEGWAVGQSGTILHFTSPSWVQYTTTTPTHNHLASVFMVSGSDGWAVGQGGTILHYDGTSWSTASSGTTNYLRSVYMVSASEGWAVGDDGTILHYDGTSWTPLWPTPTTEDLFSIRMTTDGEEGWAVGSGDTILHYTTPRVAAGSWSTVASPTTENLWSISVVGASGGWDAWVVGGREIVHYVGGAWSTVTPPPGLDATVFLSSVFMVSSSDVWAVGGGQTILHYDGVSWSIVYGNNPGTNPFHSISMVSANGWAVGGAGTILHYDGGSWMPASSPTRQDLYSVFMVPGTSEGWAVGWQGTILHYNGALWDTVTSPTTNSLRSVFMVSARQGWAVGSAGTILYYNGYSWKMVSSTLTTHDLNSVFMVSATEGWAVGSAGTILRYNGSSWSPKYGPLTTDNLHSVFMVSASEGWAVGDNGTILHYSVGLPGFGISCDPISVTVLLSATGSSTCSVTSLSGFSGTIELSGKWSEPWPTGVTPTFSPSSVTLPANGEMTATLTIAASAGASTGGPFVYHVTGTSGTLADSTDVPVFVTTGGVSILTPTGLTITFDPPLPATVDTSTTPPGVATITVTITAFVGPPPQDRVVTVYYSKDSPTGSLTVIASGATGPTGQFVVMAWTPPETGTYYFSAVFDGDTVYSSSRAESNPASLTAVPEFPSWIIPIILAVTLISLTIILRKHDSRKHAFDLK